MCALYSAKERFWFWQLRVLVWPLSTVQSVPGSSDMRTTWKLAAGYKRCSVWCCHDVCPDDSTCHSHTLYTNNWRLSGDNSSMTCFITPSYNCHVAVNMSPRTQWEVIQTGAVCGLRWASSVIHWAITFRRWSFVMDHSVKWLKWCST